jgi:transposase
MVERQDGRYLGRETQEFLRINSIERWLAGESPQSIIKTTGLCPTTIYKWIDIYERGGMEALASTKATGAQPKLSPEQQMQVRQFIVGNDPRQYGFDFGLWTRQIVSELIQEKFNVTLRLTAVGALLARLEITPQKPMRRAYERDPKAVEAWKLQRYPKIRREAKKTGAEILFWDEAGYRLDDQVGRTWGKRGKTPEVSATGKRGRTNSAIAISPNGAFWFEEYTQNLNSEMFCDLLDRFMETRRGKVILIIDSHPAHVSKRTTEHIATYGDRLRVEFLPGYAPELNPVEYVNHFAKAQGPRKQLPDSVNALRAIVDSTLGQLKGKFGAVKAFFNHPALSYI